MNITNHDDGENQHRTWLTSRSLAPTLVFIVMKMEQLLLSVSSTPSNMNCLMLWATACWMVWICWATTDRTPSSILEDGALFR